MTSIDRHKLADELDAPAREFVLWMLGALGLHVRTNDGDVYELMAAEPIPGEHAVPRRLPEGMEGRRFAFSKVLREGAAPSQAMEYVTWRSPLMQWLLRELAQGMRPVQAAASRQPLSVHELAEHLFAQYKVDNGHMHLAGCSLEDRPFLRLSYLQSCSDGGSQLVHCFGTSDGELMEETLRDALDLHDLVPLVGRTPRIDAGVVERWSQLTRQQFEAGISDRELSLIAVTLVWCKYAEGKLAFSIGQRSVQVPFCGWGRMLADRRVLPPPYHCAASGRSSYHLAATDDGRITVAEAIAVCAESSRRVLESELQVCAVTHRRVLPEYLRECPCTGAKVLLSQFTSCSMCNQQVSPPALVDAKCSACRHLASVPHDDPRLQPLLNRYPQLDRLRQLKIAETGAVHILTGSSTWKRLLCVLDKHTLAVLHMASCGRFSSKWTAVAPEQRGVWLQGSGSET